MFNIARKDSIGILLH